MNKASSEIQHKAIECAGMNQPIGICFFHCYTALDFNAAS